LIHGDGLFEYSVTPAEPPDPDPLKDHHQRPPLDLWIDNDRLGLLSLAALLNQPPSDGLHSLIGYISGKVNFVIFG